MRAVQLSHCPSVCFCFFKTNPHPKRRRTSLALEMAMDGELEHVDLGPPEVVEEVEEAEGTGGTWASGGQGGREGALSP